MCEPVLYRGIECDEVLELRDLLTRNEYGNLATSPVYDGELQRVVMKVYNMPNPMPTVDTEAINRGLVNRYLWRYLRGALKRNIREFPSWRRDEFFMGPEYTPESLRWCGKKMKVILGTAQCLTRGNSFKSEISAMGYRPRTWIAGHILNAKMGGEPVWENLVPLTASANSAHSKVEEHVKKMAAIAYRWTTKSCENHRTDFVYRVYYSIKISDESYEPRFCTKKVEQEDWPPEYIQWHYKIKKYDAWTNEEMEIGDYEKNILKQNSSDKFEDRGVIYNREPDDEDDDDEMRIRREGSVYHDQFGRAHMFVNTL